MHGLVTLRPSASAAARVLRELFGHISLPFAFRLWDGTTVPVGHGEPPFTVVFKSPESFGALMRDPSPGNFAEAYVSSAVDIEGDLYAAMDVANVVETLRIPLTRKFRLLLGMWTG
jgi:hypothetical protein